MTVRKRKRIERKVESDPLDTHRIRPPHKEKKNIARTILNHIYNMLEKEETAASI